MSNEQKDYDMEFESYRAGLLKDYQEQLMPSDTLVWTFEDYLVSRMWHEGLPEKEPSVRVI
jgi:hypothetical protein